MSRERLTGTVLRINSEKTYVYMHKSGGGGCAGCSAAGGCGTASLLEEVPTVEGVQEGDAVELTGGSAARGKRGLLFYAGHFALFAVGFATGDTLAPYFSLSPGGLFSIGSGIVFLLLGYGPPHISDFLRARKGGELRIIPPRRPQSER
jgi:hypothetical protein